jgi:hypothetical protein
MAALTLTQLRARVRARADMVGSAFVADTADSLDAIINNACDELYDILVEGDEDRYVNSAPNVIALVAGTDSYNLPADFYSAWRVDVQRGSDWLPLSRMQKAGAVLGRTTTIFTAMRYLIRGGQISFLPGPGAAGQARLWYIPTRAKLVNGPDSFDAVNGWEKFVIAEAARVCLEMEESDTGEVAREVEMQRARITKLATKADVNEVARVQDRTGGFGWDDDEVLPP